jgi:hypothetical protein
MRRDLREVKRNFAKPNLLGGFCLIISGFEIPARKFNKKMYFFNHCLNFYTLQNKKKRNQW